MIWLEASLPSYSQVCIFLLLTFSLDARDFRALNLLRFIGLASFEACLFFTVLLAEVPPPVAKVSNYCCLTKRANSPAGPRKMFIKFSGVRDEDGITNSQMGVLTSSSPEAPKPDKIRHNF